jgi:hypothetical protein
VGIPPCTLACAGIEIFGGVTGCSEGSLRGLPQSRLCLADAVVDTS